MSNRVEEGFCLLIDASSFLHRQYHACAKLTRESDGAPVGALVGMCRSLMNLLRDVHYTAINKRPDYAAFVLDARGKNFRHAMFPAYKAQRKPYDADLEAQLPHLPALGRAFNMATVQMPGYEADDLLATLASECEAAGVQVVIASGDKDLHQLVSDRVLIYDPKLDRDRGYRTDEAFAGPVEVLKRWGVGPGLMVDLQALMGDTVDNVPGAPGIGPKTAAQLLTLFGDLDEVLNAADFGEPFPSDRFRKIVNEHRDDIELSRELVRLKRDVVIGLGLEDLRVRPAKRDDLAALFKTLEAPSLLERLARV